MKRRMEEETKKQEVQTLELQKKMEAMVRDMDLKNQDFKVRLDDI